MSEWQPIETALIQPFNPELWFNSGKSILLFAGFIKIGHYGYTKSGKGRWIANGYVALPSHWMPLPDPPRS